MAEQGSSSDLLQAPPATSGVAELRALLRKWFPEVGFYVGVIAAFYFWITAAVDGYLNRSWWVFAGSDGSSFSALGDPGTNASGAAAGLSWIYNDVVIFPTAIMIMIFAAAMIVGARNRVQSTGAAFFLEAGVFLFLVGVYHGGPPTPAGYHDFVSNWFFVWAAVAILTWGVGTLWERRWLLGLVMILLVVVGVIIAAVAVHPDHWSVAQTEAWGILIIDIWLALMVFGRRRAGAPLFRMPPPTPAPA